MPKAKKTDVSNNQTSDSKGGLPPVYSNEDLELVDNSKTQASKRPVHIRVAARQGESVEQMLRRFNFAVTKSDLIQRLRDLQFYEKPSKKRQREEKLRVSQRRYGDD